MVQPRESYPPLEEGDRRRKLTEGSGPGGKKALLEDHRLPPKQATPLRKNKPTLSVGILNNSCSIHCNIDRIHQIQIQI